LLWPQGLKLEARSADSGVGGFGECLLSGPAERCNLPQWGPPAAKGIVAFVIILT